MQTTLTEVGPSRGLLSSNVHIPDPVVSSHVVREPHTCMSLVTVRGLCNAWSMLDDKAWESMNE